MLVNYLNSTKISNVEILYNRLFNDIVRNSESYFVLEEKASRVISLKFVEILIGFLNKKEIVDGIATKNLSEKEVAGLHYLGGYVLHKIYRNLKFLEQKSENNQQTMEILLSIKSSEQSSTPTFVDELSRGGLWKITEGMQKVFLITEKYFSVTNCWKGIA